MALTEDANNLPEEDLRYLGHLPVAANVVIYLGALVAMNASGYVVPASVDTTLIVLGFARSQVDNTGGAAGALTVDVDRAARRMANSDGGDEIDNAAVGSRCYVVDDNTVALTDGGGARPAAGIVRHVGTRVLVQPDYSAAGSSVLGAAPLDETITFEDFTAAATSEAVELGSLPPGVYVGYTSVPDEFTGGTISASVLEVGWSGNADGGIDGFSVFTASATLVPRVSDSGSMFTLSTTTTILATLTTTDDNVADADQGEARIVIRRIG